VSCEKLPKDDATINYEMPDELSVVAGNI